MEFLYNRLLFVFLGALMMGEVKIVQGVGMPHANFYSSSFAAALWNSTQAVARNASCLARQQAEHRLRQIREQLDCHSHYYAKTFKNKKEICGKVLATSTTETSMISQEYLSKLEQRLASIEAAQQQLKNVTTELSHKDPPLILEGLRLLAVTTLPLAAYSIVLGLLLVLVTHLLGHLLSWISDWWTPLSDRILEKFQWLVMVAAQAVVDLLGGSSKTTTTHSSPSTGHTPSIAKPPTALLTPQP